MLVLPLLAVLSSVHLEDDVAAAGGDYVVVPFTVAPGTVEIQIHHDDGAQEVILDWGVWSPEGYRGWAGGLTDDAIIGVDESSRGYLEGPITPGTWQLVIGKAKLALGAGHYTVDVTCRDNATLTPLPRAAYQPVTLATGARWYAGDFHVHSEESGDATATLDQIATLARSRGLDFVAVSDHNTTAHHPRIAAFQPSSSDVLLLRAIEVTTYAGHGNAIGVHDYVDHRVGLDGVSATTILADVTAQGGLFLINHPKLDLGESCIGCAWDHADTPWAQVSGLEVLTGPFEQTNLFTPQVLALWDEQLDAGNRLAAVGGSDDHRAGTDPPPAPAVIGNPTTLVYATELSEAAIMTAVREGRTVVKLRGPTDPMVELTVARSDGSAAMVGDTVNGIDEIVATVHVVGGGDGMELKLVRDGVAADSQLVAGADWTGEFRFDAIGGLERLRAELEAGGLRVVITSHVWVDGDAINPGGGGGCGCRGTTPTGGLVPLALVLIVLAGQSSARSRLRRASTAARSSARSATF